MPTRTLALLATLHLLLACTPADGDDAGSSDADAASSTPTSSADTGEPAPYVPVDGDAFPWADESRDAVCDDGEDNDGNGYVDCDDFSCSRNPSVSVCGASSVYESSAALCDNGDDDDDDGLTDCEDPDCFKNPFHAVCDKPRGETACEENEDADGDGLVGCADADCAVDVAACPPAAGSLRVLFDQSADETAGAGPNSDWVVDPWGRLPAPSNPGGADEWHGALSSFGYELHASGHRVENLVPWSGELTYGDADNPQDLGLYDVVVIFEPSRGLGPDEQDAIVNYVLAGGGLLAVANHVGADRDGNGFSAPEVWNDLIDDNGVLADPFGFRFDEVDVDVPTPIANILAPDHAVLAGVTQIGFFKGCTARLTGGAAQALGLLALDGQPDALVVGAAQAGAGRVVFLTDSAIGSDGSDSHGNQLGDHDAWNDPKQDNARLLLNAVAWLGAG